jgi:hypothetical protein
MNATKRDGGSPLGSRDHEQNIEETAIVMRTWRMIMVEECCRWLFGNSVAEKSERV